MLGPWPWSGKGPIEKGDWFAMATAADLERVVRKVLNEGTGFGQKNWAGTSKATLRSIQSAYNLINQQMLPKLNSIVAATTGTPPDPTPPSAGVAAGGAVLSDQADDDGEVVEPIPDDVVDPVDVDVPAGALAALSELYLTLSPEQANILAALFAALGEQEDVGD